VNLDLNGKIAIVTGSSKGLGLACATALVEEGCRVTICARGEDGLLDAVTKLRTLPGGDERVLAVQADLSTDKGVADVIIRTVETFGGLDILVNNVGLGKGAGIVDTSDAEWHEAFDQTLFPAVRASRLAVPHPPLKQETAARQSTMLVFKDKRRQEIQNYAVVGGTLWILDEKKASKVPLSDLDVEATTRLNDERGVEFELPR